MKFAKLFVLLALLALHLTFGIRLFHAFAGHAGTTAAIVAMPLLGAPFLWLVLSRKHPLLGFHSPAQSSPDHANLPAQPASNADAGRKFLSAAGRDWLLPFYDGMTALMGATRVRNQLLDEAALRSGQRILEVGCGTGSLLVSLKRRYPASIAIGLDPDAKALARAQRKAHNAGLSVQFDRGFADSLPYMSASFDRVLSSLMLHHLPERDKSNALREILRVLKPGGQLHLLDFVEPSSPRDARFARRLHFHPRLKNNTEAKIHALLLEAGFDVTLTRYDLLRFGLGRLAHFRASAPTT